MLGLISGFRRPSLIAEPPYFSQIYPLKAELIILYSEENQVRMVLHTFQTVFAISRLFCLYSPVYRPRQGDSNTNRHRCTRTIAPSHLFCDFDETLHNDEALRWHCCDESTRINLVLPTCSVAGYTPLMLDALFWFRNESKSSLGD